MYTFLLIMGIVSYLLILSSFFTGMRIIKVKYKVHKIIGIIGFTSASIHGLLMVYYNLL